MLDSVQPPWFRTILVGVIGGIVLSCVLIGCADQYKSAKNPVSRHTETDKYESAREMEPEVKSVYESQFERVPKSQKSPAVSPTEDQP